MLIIMGVLSYVTAALSGSARDNGRTHILATLLFYKDNKDQILLARGTVPAAVEDAVKADISSRIGDVVVKVVPIFNELNIVPKSVDIFEYMKSRFKNVLVTPIPKRSARNILIDMWDFFSHIGHKKNRPRPIYRETNTKPSTRPSISKLPGLTPEKNLATKKTTPKVKHGDNEYDDKGGNGGGGDDGNEGGGDDGNEDGGGGTKRIVSPTTAASPTNGTNTDPFADFLPNDIYYNIEKKCVNWSDGCGRLNNNIFNMSSQNFEYVYKRPRIVNWVR